MRRLVPLLRPALLAGCSGGGEAKDEPFTLEDVSVEPIEAATSDELADAIVEQLDGRLTDTYHAPSGLTRTRKEVSANWAALVGLAVYRDQKALNDLPNDGLDATASNGVRFGLSSGGLPAVSIYRTASEDAFRGIVERNIDDLGLELVSLEFVQPEGIMVPVALVRAPDEFLERSGGAPLGYSIFNGAAAESRSLGWFADVVDEDGEWVQSQGLVPTTGAGGRAVAARWSTHDECGGPVLCSAHL